MFGGRVVGKMLVRYVSGLRSPVNQKLKNCEEARPTSGVCRALTSENNVDNYRAAFACRSIKPFVVPPSPPPLFYFLLFLFVCVCFFSLPRFVIYACIKNPWAGLPAEALRGVTFAGFWAASTCHVGAIAPPGLSTTMVSQKHEHGR